MSSLASLRDFLRRRVYAGRYAPDLRKEGRLLAFRMDQGAFPVIYSGSSAAAPLGAANFVGRELGDRPALFLLFFTWASHGRLAVDRSVKALSVYRQRRPHHRFVFLCNAERERAAHEAAGLAAVLCNHNAFVDEEVFAPGDATIRYDAVHNAAMVDWKRHHLSGLVNSCLQITYDKKDVPHEVTMARFAALRAAMPSHDFVNEIVDGNIALLRSREVVSLLRQARVGLCLSAVEGAMFASMEYLLTGLPVVSTPSTGGRDEFADPEYWLTVDVNAEAVSAGVAEMIRRNLPREHIRARALGRVYQHRSRLRDVVAQHTDGKVDLPANLGDQAYRFITDIVPWPKVADLQRQLQL